MVSARLTNAKAANLPRAAVRARRSATGAAWGHALRRRHPFLAANIIAFAAIPPIAAGAGAACLTISATCTTVAESLERRWNRCMCCSRNIPRVSPRMYGTSCRIRKSFQLHTYCQVRAARLPDTSTSARPAIARVYDAAYAACTTGVASSDNTPCTLPQDKFPASHALFAQQARPGPQQSNRSQRLKLYDFCTCAGAAATGHPRGHPGRPRCTADQGCRRRHNLRLRKLGPLQHRSL